MVLGIFVSTRITEPDIVALLCQDERQVAVFFGIGHPHFRRHQESMVQQHHGLSLVASLRLSGLLLLDEFIEVINHFNALFWLKRLFSWAVVEVRVFDVGDTMDA